MRDGFIKVAAATPDILVADCAHNRQEIVEKAREMAGNGAKILVFPELCLTGYTCQDLFWQGALLHRAEEELKTIQREKELTMLLISHDMEIVRRVCDEVIVMYRGEAVEKGRVESVFGNPQHVYTRLLLDCNEENVKKWIDYKKGKGKRGNKNEE